MKRPVFLASLAGLVVLATTGRGAFAHTPTDVIASNWKFTPSELTVKAGEPVTLHLTSSGGVHGIVCEELGIPATTIVPGKFVDVTFTPKKAGTFAAHCSVICGAGHADMKLTVKVEA